MIKQGMTIKEATAEYVRGFNAIDQAIIAKLMRIEPDSWIEETAPAYGDRCYVYGQDNGEIVGIHKNDDGEKVYEIRLDGEDEEIECKRDDFCVEYDYGLPMWGTMWSFDNSIDDYWLAEKDGIEVMSECGFRIFYSDDYGYFFGIDGAGYDFYESHWIPLYKARGLRWHDPETEGKE